MLEGWIFNNEKTGKVQRQHIKGVPLMKDRVLCGVLRTVFAAGVAFVAVSASAADKHWRGTMSELASADGNWAEGAAPTGDDSVVIDGDSANKPMTRGSTARASTA